jgi:GDP-L-fucose synthase
MSEKVLITGGSGLVGRWLQKTSPKYTFLSSKDFDLTSEKSVVEMYEKHNPDTVIHLAARVGGIVDNIQNPCNYFEENVLMNTLLLKYARINNVKKFLGILSTCIYPDVMDSYPLKEDCLHKGEPTKTNFSYGYAKRDEQYGTNYNYLIPCNLYGDGDKNDPSKSHFVTALITKIHEAVKNNDKEITLFGDGSPLRQFLHAEDFALVINEIIKKNITSSFNVAAEEVYSIKEIAEIALDACGATHLKVNFDTSKPNGQYRKDVCINKLKKFIPNFNPKPLHQGIKETYNNIKNE